MADLADLYAQFPSLSGTQHKITSEDDDKYNCAAWVQRDTHHWYEPGMPNWPAGLPEPSNGNDIHCFIALFESWGFELCDAPCHEEGYLKIALYTMGAKFCHVAKQIRESDWSSKAGVLHDFRHESLEALYPCGIMENARPSVYMRRPDDGTDQQHLERVGLLPI